MPKLNPSHMRNVGGFFKKGNVLLYSWCYSYSLEMPR